VECDANFFKDEDVAVVGGASAAVGGALTLLDYAKTVNLICEKLDVADTLATELKKSNVVIHANAKVQEICGDTGVKGILLADGPKIPIAGVFIELGARGVMELAAHVGIQFDDEMKYIDTNKKMETNVAGVFAAGDICGPPWQMAKAVGEGCIAGIAAAAYAKKMRSSD
jgi:thioredoxin reductase (NADPH)